MRIEGCSKVLVWLKFLSSPRFQDLCYDRVTKLWYLAQMEWWLQVNVDAIDLYKNRGI